MAPTMMNANKTIVGNSVGLEQPEPERTKAVRRRGQQATSLIEVMVVLVVLIFGIFLAIRIFPEGFGILRANGNRTLATRLAEQEIGQARSDAANLPDGVLFSYQGGPNGGLTTITNVDPDDLGAYKVNPGDPEPPYNPYFTDVNKFRFIKGEAVKIPLPQPGLTSEGKASYGVGSIYTCKFGPIYMNGAVGNRSNVPTTSDEQTAYDSYLAVNGAPLVGINVEADPNNPGRYRGLLRNEQVYLIDYGGEDNKAYIMFTPRPPAGRTNPNRIYSVTLTYQDGNNNGYITATEKFTVPDSYSPVWQPLAATGECVPGSDVVTRSFQRIAFAAAWDSGDPYQYKLLSDNIQTGDAATFANMGVLAFNPAGANYSEATTYGVRPFTAYVDYNVLDWHILREDREVPSVFVGSGDTVPLRTTLRDLKRIGDTEDGSAIYNGLYGGTQRAVDLDIFDLNDATGLPLVAGDYNGGNPVDKDPYTGNDLTQVADYYIEKDEKAGTYRTGTIYINTSRRPAGSKLRILYKAQGDWAVAMQKSFARYQMGIVPNTTNTPIPFPLKGRHDLFGLSGTGNSAQLRFPLSDLNKSFIVTIQYQKANGDIRRLPPIQMTADEKVTDLTADATLYDQEFAVINVAKYLPASDVGDPDNPRDGLFDQATVWGVSGTVQGISIKTRVIWHDTDTPGQKWRVQDMDTYLTQRPEGIY